VFQKIILTFEFALVLTKVMVLSIHNNNTSLLQETVTQAHQMCMQIATQIGERMALGVGEICGEYNIIH
jgi:hypothetical protein